MNVNLLRVFIHRDRGDLIKLAQSSARRSLDEDNLLWPLALSRWKFSAIDGLLESVSTWPKDSFEIALSPPRPYHYQDPPLPVSFLPAIKFLISRNAPLPFPNPVRILLLSHLLPPSKFLSASL